MNELDELPVLDEGHDAVVIAKKIDVRVGFGSKFFNIMWWFLPPIIGGIVWSILKVRARNSLKQLEQKIQHDASQIDDYLEQRVQILKNCARLLDRAVDLDERVFTRIAALRSGAGAEGDEARNAEAAELGAVESKVNFAFENYPELRAHEEIAEAMRQNSYLQREITAAREVYNDSVALWNREIFLWPTKQIVAAQAHYTTRIPFIADKETREAARGTFF